MESFAAKNIKIIAVIAAYWFVSISLVFLNKYLLSSPDLKLEAPLFVTWFQCVVSLLLCALLATVAKLTGKITFPEFKIDIKVSREVLPLSIVFVSMITCNNLCLKYVGVSFYYVGRSLTTVFNVVFSYFILMQTNSARAIGCCALIVFGFLLGVNQENALGSLSVLGLCFGVGASAFVALYSIYTKKVLPAVDNNVWRLTLYNNFNATFLFLPLILMFGEVPEIIHFNKLLDVNFWIIMLISGVFGFLIGYVTGLQIQVTSPLSHNISGTAKAAAQTVLGTVYFHEVKSTLWWVSNAVVLIGSGLYTHVKRSEMKQIHDQEVVAREAADAASKKAAEDAEKAAVKAVEIEVTVDDIKKEKLVDV